MKLKYLNHFNDLKIPPQTLEGKPFLDERLIATTASTGELSIRISLESKKESGGNI